ncbi:hypothetical protein PR202_ga16484 [Eleusine coracana subsp. coracana]|uniref:Acyl carrier protein n=1 Tax=Eleusine coracana subsp. coracana TaxID=191504 RepID=A0AAV5CMY9_ELECO|nr:hypothetical protein PR202_ga16484 [Eleusine coracana subsp. coracana]
MLGEGPWEEGEGPDDMWLKMATCVRKVASEVFGVSRGGKQEAKDTWWWNDKVQRAIKEKKECFKRLHLDKSATNIEGYKIAKRAAKRAVSVAKGQAYDNLYQRLGTKEGEKDIYRMARIRERKTRDINQIKCIKDGVDRLLTLCEKNSGDRDRGSFEEDEEWLKRRRWTRCDIVKKQLALADDHEVAGSSKFQDLGADSLDTVEIVMGLEEAFGISVEESSAQSIATVEDAANLIDELVAAK